MDRLKELRKKKHLTLKELSEQLKENGVFISSDSLAKYERGDRKPKIDKLKALARFFNVSISYLEGITPDLDDLTSETKEFIISKLDEFYFVEDDASEYVIDLKSSVDEYVRQAQLALLPNEIKSKPRNKRAEYWNKNFAFLFKNGEVVRRFSFYLNRKEEAKKEAFINKLLAHSLSRAIAEYTIDEFQTALGFFITKDKNLKRIEGIYRAFERRINFSNSLEEASNEFDEYISALIGIKKTILKEAQNINTNDLLKKRLSSSISKQYANLVRYNSDFYAEQSNKNLNNTSDYAEQVREYALRNKEKVPNAVKEYLEKYTD